MPWWGWMIIGVLAAVALLAILLEREADREVAAVEELLDRCDKVSPNAVIEARLVREAITTGQMPELPQRKAMF